MTLPSASPDQVTRYLQQMESGDSAAVSRLLPHIYSDLRRLAEKMFSDQRGGHTLQPTALVHEAYMRLVKPSNAGWESRKHFLRVAAMAMRQLLTDYARRRNADKRAGGHVVVDIDDAGEIAESELGVDLIALEEALAELRELDERQAQIVELRFLTGLSVDEVAEVLSVSRRTVYLDWNMARSWLEQRLAEE